MEIRKKVDVHMTPLSPPTLPICPVQTLITNHYLCKLSSSQGHSTPFQNILTWCSTTRLPATSSGGAAFPEQLWDSIFTTRVTPVLLLVMNIPILLLHATHPGFLAVTRSIHFVMLNAIAAGLWCAINRVIREV